MTVSDSLQTLGGNVFYKCSKLVPSNIEPSYTPSVIAYLRSQRTCCAISKKFLLSLKDLLPVVAVLLPHLQGRVLLLRLRNTVVCINYRIRCPQLLKVFTT
ncbi:hypothetical protein TrLO_g2999 [Triparma laevis f. longispina]|uniref:Uncharacterized protein n=1 Tax=Triparma laevis f. longispina TaxID=1714387 RepID=A0A9W7F5R4_9STRA|nr:hypothetical protein TrLO_g2999 [Triparma laevis f. longispina]